MFISLCWIFFLAFVEDMSQFVAIAVKDNKCKRLADWKICVEPEDKSLINKKCQFFVLKAAGLASSGAHSQTSSRH